MAERLLDQQPESTARHGHRCKFLPAVLRLSTYWNSRKSLDQRPVLYPPTNKLTSIVASLLARRGDDHRETQPVGQQLAIDSTCLPSPLRLLLQDGDPLLPLHLLRPSRFRHLLPLLHHPRRGTDRRPTIESQSLPKRRRNGYAIREIVLARSGKAVLWRLRRLICHRSICGRS